MTANKSVLQEAERSERGLLGVRIGIGVFWLLALTALILGSFYLQHQDSSRANHRLDNLEQNDLPAKSAYRDAQIEKERKAICAALAHEPQTADVTSARASLSCASKTVPSSTPAASKPRGNATAASPSATVAAQPSSARTVAPSSAPAGGTRTATATRTAPGPTVTVRPSSPPTSAAPAPVPTPTAPCLLGLVCLHLR